MAVALGDGGALVHGVGLGTGNEVGDPGAETHGAPEVDDLFLLLEKADDGVGGAFVELGAVGIVPAADVAGELDDGDLHAEADAEEGDVVFAGVAGGGDFPLSAAVAKATGDEDALEAFEVGFGPGFFNALGIDADDLDLGVVGGSGVGEGFVDAFVGVLKLDVLSDDSEADVMGGMDDALDKLAPAGEVGLGGVGDVEDAADHVVEPFFVELDGDLVDGVLDIANLDDALDGDVAEEGDFLPDIFFQWHLGTAEDDLGANPDLAKLGDALLGGLGLQLTCGADVGDEGGVDEEDVSVADLLTELTYGFEEGQALDVADGAADLGDDDVAGHLVGDGVDAGLDLVGDMGNDLDGAALVFSSTFFLEDGGVNLTAGEVVEAGEIGVGEALVVTEVEIGLGPVIEDVDLAVLVRVHRAGVDVQVGVKFLHDDPESAMLQKSAEGGGGKTFAE